VSRARVADAFLALLAVGAVVAPFRALFTPDSWIPAAVVMALSVTVTGMVMRAVSRRDATVVTVQIGVGVLLAGWVFGRGHLWYGLPTWQTILAFNDILVDARETITSYAPPAPSGPGVVLAMALIVWLTMLVVDVLIVTRGSPTLGGIPLVTAFIIAASNSGPGMPMWHFAAAALLWLLLLTRSETLSLSRWDRRVRDGTGRGTGISRLVATARVVAVASVTVAVVAATFVPHMPTRFLLDGLGRSTDATGRTGTMTINSTVNLARSLESQSTEPVLAYRSSDSAPPPLRVAVLDVYERGEWREREVLGVPRSDDLVTGPTDPESETESFVVSANNLAAPQLALPYPATSLTIDAEWQSRVDGTVLVDRRVDGYSADYVSRIPAEEVLQESGSVPSGVGNLSVDAQSADVVGAVLDEIITPGMSQIDKARAIQEHLRGPEYTYSLELAGPTADRNGNLVQLDPLSHFLLTKQGYCTQFASAMVMMARAEGIPSRFVIGFLPGTATRGGERGGERTVVAADAHAWPELYFSGIGWLRFEPTPATRAGSSPPYASAAWGDPDAPTPTTTATPTPTSAPTQQRPEDLLADDLDTPAGSLTPQSPVAAAADRFGWLALVLLAGALGAGAMPASAWWERRRRRHAAADDAERIEVIWQDLLERLDDVGITPPVDATPRQTGTYIWDQSFLTKESRVALSRVVAAVERARYAPPDRDSDPRHVSALEHDAHTVSANVVGSLQRSERLRATYWPTAGVTVWRRLSAAIARAVPRRGS
jgi:transglutaminase-like putative cysteine protease